MASVSVNSSVMDLIAQADAAPREKKWHSLQQVKEELLCAKRSLDEREQDFRHRYGQLYKKIGQVRDALDSLREHDQQNVDLTSLDSTADRALCENTVPALVGARRELQAAQDECQTPSYCRCLGRKIRQINAALRHLNDQQARKLINRFNALSQSIWQASDTRDYQRVLSEYSDLLRVTQDIRDAKPCLRSAFNRIEPEANGWPGLISHLTESLGDTKAMVEAAGRTFGQNFVGKAKDLASRFKANMKNGNLGAARKILQELSQPENAAGLTVHLGSVKERDQFMATARQSLLTQMQTRRRQKTS